MLVKSQYKGKSFSPLSAMGKKSPTEIRKEMGQNAKKYSDENLDWQKIAIRTLEVYKNC